MIASERQSVHLEPSTAFIANPGMGWVVYGEAADFADERVLALAAVGYTRFEWHQLQPAEDRFDWQPLDDFIAGWAARGKTAAFGVMAANSHSAQPHVTPAWVFEAGAAFQMSSVGDHVHAVAGAKVVPDFRDPVFLAKLDGFLQALAARYDHDPRIAFIDIRSYGNWGEGHVGHLGGRAINDEEFIAHLRLHHQAFRHTRLIVPLTDDLAQYRAVAEWAVEHGIGVRRDGIVGNSDGSETAIAHGRTPAVFEWYQNYAYLQQQGWWDGRSRRRGYGYPLADCIERGHPSYVQLGYWGGADVAAFVAAESELVERLSRRIGYRLVITEVELPRRLVAGQEVALTVSIANQGVAHVLVPCHPALALLDEAGTLHAVTWLAGADPAAWTPGATVTQTWRAVLPAQVPIGTVRLVLGLNTTREANATMIRPANADCRVDGWLPVASVLVSTTP